MGLEPLKLLGTSAFSGVSMGNNQMDQLSDSRDLFLPDCG